MKTKNRAEWMAWCNAKARCTNPNHPSWKNYGGRGIAMCPEWAASFDAFLAYLGPRPVGYTLERIDNNKGYQPGNVKWATRSEQQKNRRVHCPRLAVEDRAEVRRLAASGAVRAHIARQFGISPAYVTYLCK